MGKAKFRDLPDLSGRAIPGAEIAVCATPKAGRNRVVAEDGGLRIYVTAVAEGGKANAAIRAILAAAMGVPQTSLILLRGQTGRDKVFRYDGSGSGS